MKIAFLAVTLAALVGIGLWHLRSPHQSLDPVQSTNSEEDNVSTNGGLKQDESKTKLKWQGHLFEIDLDRLFDRGYESDPGLQALAKATDTPPACIIALAKHKIYKIPIESGVCPSPYAASLRGEKGNVFPPPGDSHPYDEYSDVKLKAMAQYDSAAAMIFARRVKDDQVSLHYYERALILTGNPQPLIEWLNYRTPGESLSTNEDIDVEQAKLGYKIYLVTSAFGLGKGVAENYEERLLAAGIDIEATKAEAEEIADRIKKERNGLFPTSNNRES